MAENTISPELLDRINQFAGAGAVSDQEMMMMQDAQPMMGPAPSMPMMGSGAVSDQELMGFMQGLQELEQQKQMSNDPDEIEAIRCCYYSRLTTGANAPLGDLARQVQEAGTGEDTQLAHLSPGEIVLPAEFMQDLRA
jgi:hypothetical protein